MKKRIVAILLVLAMAVCAFPVCAFADNPQVQSATTATLSIPAQTLRFKDCNGDIYRVESGTLVSQGSSHVGYILVIQEVLHRLYLHTGNNNFNPNGVDGIFGNGTRSAVVCFQVAYISANDADGVVGPTTWWYLHDTWKNELNSPYLTSVVQ